MRKSNIVDPKIGFGRRLRELRQQAKLSQEALGALAGLDRTYISGCERGKRNASLEALHQLAHALNISPSALLSPAEETLNPMNDGPST